MFGLKKLKEKKKNLQSEIELCFSELEELKNSINDFKIVYEKNQQLDAYYNKIQKYAFSELIIERKKIYENIEYYEKNKIYNNSKFSDIYNLELLKLNLIINLQISSLSNQLTTESRTTLHDGDIVKINGNTYHIEVVIDKNRGVKLKNNIIEVHIPIKYIKDYSYINRTLNMYKKNLNL